MTAEQGRPLDRLFSGLRRWWGENIVAWEPQAEIGSDDEPVDDLDALIDALNRPACVSVDPAVKRLQRDRMVEAVRDRATVRAVLDECERIGLLPVAEQQ